MKSSLEIEGSFSPPKTFHPYYISEMLRLPPSVGDRLPDHHVARFSSEVLEDFVDFDMICSFCVEASLRLRVNSLPEMERRYHGDVAFH